MGLSFNQDQFSAKYSHLNIACLLTKIISKHFNHKEEMSIAVSPFMKKEALIDLRSTVSINPRVIEKKYLQTRSECGLCHVSKKSRIYH